MPTAANAGYYAEIVSDQAVLRRLVQAGTRITAMGYARQGEVADLVDAAGREVLQAATARDDETLQPFSVGYGDSLDRIQAAGQRGGEITGSTSSSTATAPPAPSPSRQRSTSAASRAWRVASDDR